MTRTVAPYGTWTSPITADLLVEKAVAIEAVQVEGPGVTWSERRPGEGGRVVVAAAGRDLLPPGFSARTSVHEYGGRCATFTPDGALIASNWEDQRLWRFPPGGGPEPLTPEPPAPRALRYADPVVTPDGGWAICVREHHHGGRVDNEIVAVPLAPPGEPLVVASGHDFYAAPRVSPDGSRLAWLSWDHPDMPWDHTELWIADLDAGAGVSGATVVAGGARDSILQPRWSPAGVLHWVSDETGWWNLYADGGPLCPMEAELSPPGWVFGESSYDFLADGRVVATWAGPSGSGIGVIEEGTVAPIPTPYGSFRQLHAAGEAAVCVAASPTEAAAVVRIGLDGSLTVLRRSRDIDLDPAYLSTPEQVSFPTAGGETAWALVYPPASADHEGPPGEAPPLVVTCHGGPTSAARSDLDLGLQYWTSRGFAVADVDYRGSTGYGRAYRERLRGDWGVCDVEDCAGVAAWLAGQGRVDPDRLVIRGGSAGGYTTLAALAFTDVFAAGGSHYGVADLEALVGDDHKFESRYGDRMIGPLPDALETYRARSPIHHLEGFDCPVILFQGLEDKVVPPAQSEMIYKALKEKGLPVTYLAFEGEQHGFRKAETIRRVAEAELEFYLDVLGLSAGGGRGTSTRR